MPNLAWRLNVVSLRKLHTEEPPERIVSEYKVVPVLDTKQGVSYS